MLIHKLLFCYYKKAAGGIQMTTIVESEEDKCSPQICMSKLPVIHETERKGLLPFGSQSTKLCLVNKEQQ